MRKIMRLFILGLTSLMLLSCKADDMTFEQELQYDNIVAIVQIVSNEGTYLQDKQKRIDFQITFIEVLKGDITDITTLTLLHSDDKIMRSYCVLQGNDLFHDCYNETTEEYVEIGQFYIISSIYSRDSDNALAGRYIEKLEGYDISLSYRDQSDKINAIINRYTRVLESDEVY
ncbi:MAG: hypothetical protein AB1414_06755 [bacterium]